MIAPQRSAVGVEETRARILAAAREIFERKGTRGTTTREVAERAGVNEATLFRHFGSKATLIAAMREDACGVAAFREAFAALDGEHIGNDLKMIARLSARQMLAKRALMVIGLAEDARGDTLPAVVAEGDCPEWRGPATILNLLTEYFTERVARGQIVGDPPVLGRIVMGMIFQLVVAERLWSAYVIDDQLVDTLVDVFLNGVKA